MNPYTNLLRTEQLYKEGFLNEKEYKLLKNLWIDVMKYEEEKQNEL